jgi:AcrR family transcriptional regulator
MPDTPRDRVLAAAMQLFSQRGFAGTTITQIERAAGLSPGSGGIYRHFTSKRAILAAGVASSITSNAGLVSLINDAEVLASLPLRERLLTLARAGLRRLEQEGDLNRLVMRDLSQFPDLLAQVGQDDIGRIFRAFAGWLEAQPDVTPGRDWEAIAMVLMGAITHFWIMREIFGEHPAGIDEDRYLTAAADLAAASLTNEGLADQRRR